jgi:CTD kinase subunit beta
LDDHVGPHPSFIEIAKPYIFEQRLQEYMTAIGMNEAREDAVRLQGVAWIDNVRRSMQLYGLPHP